MTMAPSNYRLTEKAVTTDLERATDRALHTEGETARAIAPSTLASLEGSPIFPQGRNFLLDGVLRTAKNFRQASCCRLASRCRPHGPGILGTGSMNLCPTTRISIGA
mmetsp:Transcript_27538/g.56439  ORF Transcript_27538/g.56439 Transcript_27538/m.56439 type:complete len:107 (+) Transcript_27538:410-730(+)